MRDFALFYASQQHISYPVGADLLQIKFKFFRGSGYQREIDPPRVLDTCYVHQPMVYLSEAVLEVHPSSNRTANLRDRIAKLLSDSIRITENDQSIIIERIFKVLDDPVPDLPVVVRVAEVTMQIVDDIDSAIIASKSLRRLSPPKVLPATASSIVGLERVGLDSSELKSIVQDTPSCVICMESLDYSVDDDATEEEEGVFDPDLKRRRGIVITRMPCLHCYHEECIVCWLEMNHCCPICRYPMPAVDVGAGHQNPNPNKRARLH